MAILNDVVFILMKWKSLYITLIVCSILSYVLLRQVLALATACTASVSPNSISSGATADIVFTINNTDGVDFNWIKITRPSQNFTINSGNASGASGWGSSVTSDSVTFSGGSLGAQNTGSATINVTAGTGVSSQNWTVQVSDDSGGTSFTCSGSLGVAITGAADTTAPSISDVTISNITASQATISWTTSEAASSSLSYGTTTALGATESISSLTTSHSITLQNLSIFTNYYFTVSSTDASGNTSLSSTENFTTASVGQATQTITVTTTITTTTIQTVTPTPTPTPIPDTTVPLITLTTSFDKPFKATPKIFGTARDASSIESIEYSIDNGTSWLPVDTFTKGKVTTPYSFTPSIVDDGNYKILVRAKDTKNNTGYQRGLTLVIDRLPPIYGGMLFSLGPQSLESDENGKMLTIAGVKQKLTISAKGGPTKMEVLTSNMAQSQNKIASQAAVSFDMKQSIDTGLWSSDLIFTKPGQYELLVRAIDGASNMTERLVQPITVLPAGNITTTDRQFIPNATVTVYYQEPVGKQWVVWDGMSYGQENPQLTENDGSYAYFLPPGKYYLTIQAKGQRQAISDIFVLSHSQPITTSFTLNPSRRLRLGTFTLPFIDFSSDTINIENARVSVSSEKTHTLINKEAPQFVLPTTLGTYMDLLSTRGRPTDIIMLSMWAPAALEQITIVDKMYRNRAVGYDTADTVVVAVHDSVSALSIFQKRGGYQMPFVVDTDGVLVEQYHLYGLPTHYFLDAHGVVREVISGVLSKQEIDGHLQKTRK